MLEIVRKLLLKRSRLELYGRGLGPLKGGEKGSEIKIWKYKNPAPTPFFGPNLLPQDWNIFFGDYI